MENFISVNDALPETKDLTSDDVVFIVEGKEYAGHYHSNGWFYGDGSNRLLFMAQGPKATCGFQSWDELPKRKATAWKYAVPNNQGKGLATTDSKQGDKA